MTTTRTEGVHRFRPVLTVRVRIATTVAVLVAAALAGAGVMVYVVERERIDDAHQREVEQEFDEFRKLQADGTDPDTGEPFVMRTLLDQFLRINVPDDDELLVGWIGDRPTHWFPADDPLVEEAAFREAAAPLVTAGGSTRLDTEHGDVRITSQPLEQGDRVGALLVVAYLAEDRAELHDTMRTYTIVALLSLIAITAAAAWQSGRLLRPLRTLRRTAEDITDTDLAQRLPVSGNDDITALTRTFNGMLDRLEDAFGEQRQFLDDAGHELKTPLTVLRGHLELLDTGSPADVAETKALLLDEVDRMAALVADLIVLAKSTRPDFLSLDELVPADLVEDVVAKARVLGTREWSVDLVGPRTPMIADHQRLTQALLALAENAVKHTSPGAEIGIGCEEIADRLRFWVRDTGPGVAPQDRQRIFERFGRAAVPDGDEGFGLGLSIVRAIAEAHGGTVDVAPADPGARFIIEIPVVRRAPAPGEEEPWHAS